MARPRLPWSSATVALLACAIVLPAGVTPVGAQQREEVVITRRASRPAMDSAERSVRRLKARADSLGRMYGDDDASPAERQRIGEELDRTIGELERELGLLRANASLRFHVVPLASARAAEAMSRALVGVRGAPRGWLGIVVNGVAREPRIEGGELIVHYLTYPEIISVEPSSPAERAGLVPGDTLIAYDGRDVRDADISMTRLLKPNARVLVRIAREGRQRDVPVTIADAPTRIVLRGTELNGMSLAGIADPMARASTGGFPRAPGAPTPPLPPAGVRRPVGAVAPAAPSAPVAPAAPSGVAGAQMSSVTASWARLTGVANGVLILQAPPGSLAAESGLRDADVIVKAGGRAVRTVPELRDQIAIAWTNGERALAIEFVRERKARSGMLRW